MWVKQKRTLKVRLSEYRQAVRQGEPKNGIAVHVQKSNHCINCMGWCHSPKTSQSVLAEEDCGGHPDPKLHPEHEPQQRPSPSCGLELNPEPTPHTSHLSPLLLLYSYFSLCLVNSMSILHDYHFYVFYC